MFEHKPVLPKEVLDNFKPLSEGSLIIDCTIGKGGHTKILLDNGFRVIGIDRDKEAINEASKNTKVKIIHDNFSNIKNVLKRENINSVNGILVDLGVSTYQLENPKRGFGFSGNLDMRMNQDQTVTAAHVVNNYSFEDLKRVLYDYGEKVNAHNIAKKILEYRQKNEITTGGQLLKIIKFSINENYRKSRKHHWATPTFRALRIEVNKDFENIEKLMDSFYDCLCKGGILEIITFHSMEENIIKKRLTDLEEKDIISFVTKKPISSTKEENLINPKSRRAKLWVAIKK